MVLVLANLVSFNLITFINSMLETATAANQTIQQGLISAVFTQEVPPAIQQSRTTSTTTAANNRQ